MRTAAIATAAVLTVLVGLWGLSGCKDEPKQPSTSSAGRRGEIDPNDTGYFTVLAKAHEKGQSTMCLVRLKSLGGALMQYANANNGQFPATLQMLADQGLISAEALRCPEKPYDPYVFVQNLTDKNSQATIIAYDPTPHADLNTTKPQIYVLRLGWQAEAIPQEQLADQLKVR